MPTGFFWLISRGQFVAFKDGEPLTHQQRPKGGPRKLWYWAGGNGATKASQFQRSMISNQKQNNKRKSVSESKI